VARPRAAGRRGKLPVAAAAGGTHGGARGPAGLRRPARGAALRPSAGTARTGGKPSGAGAVAATPQDGNGWHCSRRWWQQYRRAQPRQATDAVRFAESAGVAAAVVLCRLVAAGVALRALRFSRRRRLDG